MSRRRRGVGRSAAPPPAGSLVGSLPTRLDRRSFLVGAGLALPAWLAACGAGESESEGTDHGTGGGATATLHGTSPQETRTVSGPSLPQGVTIAPRFPDDSLVPGPVRLPISFLIGGALLTNGPTRIDASIVDPDGTPLVEDLTATAVEGVTEQPQFWIVRAAVDQPGIYALRLDGIDEPAPFQVLDRSQVDVPKPGDPLPPFDTPTIDDPRGVDPICTRADGVCDLHTMTLTEALQQGKPTAYLIGTPAHCQFGVCGPMLESLLKVHDEMGNQVAMVHADVYTDDTASTPTKAVRTYALSWEPTLFVADAEGTIVDRLDITYSVDELRETLARAGA